MLSQYVEKVKSWILNNKSDCYVAILIFLVGLASFGLGRLSVLWPKKEPIEISNSQFLISNDEKRKSAIAGESASTISSVQGKYVASKNGTAYHFPWCSGAQKIKEENKMWFQTKEEAEKSGYKPAGNCEGL